MRGRGRGHRQPVEQVRAQHLVFDLHLVRGQEEPALGEERRGYRVCPRVQQPLGLQRPQPAGLAHPASPPSRTLRAAPGRCRVFVAARVACNPAPQTVDALFAAHSAGEGTDAARSVDTAAAINRHPGDRRHRPVVDDDGAEDADTAPPRAPREPARRSVAALRSAHAERVCQVHSGAGFGEYVGGPVVG